MRTHETTLCQWSLVFGFAGEPAWMLVIEHHQAAHSYGEHARQQSYDKHPSTTSPVSPACPMHTWLRCDVTAQQLLAASHALHQTASPMPALHHAACYTARVTP
jgi:hypothetical protein